MPPRIKLCNTHGAQLANKRKHTAAMFNCPDCIYGDQEYEYVCATHQKNAPASAQTINNSIKACKSCVHPK